MRLGTFFGGSLLVSELMIARDCDCDFLEAEPRALTLAFEAGVPTGRPGKAVGKGGVIGLSLSANNFTLNTDNFL